MNNPKEINTQRAILEYDADPDYDMTMKYIDILTKRYNTLSFSYIGESIMGRGIPKLCLGDGEKEIYYVSGHSASDGLGVRVLLRFVNEYCELLERDGRVFNYSVKYLFGTRRISVIPMLNPDGVQTRLYGTKKEDILYERLLSMNGGDDFTNWSANARGVALKGNYADGFEERKLKADENGIYSGGGAEFCGEFPESEPEIGAISAHMRFSSSLLGAVSLDRADQCVRYRARSGIPKKGKSVAESISRMIGNKSVECQRGEDGFLDFCSEGLNIPSFSIGYSDEKDGSQDLFSLYTRIRQALFTLPFLV